MGFAERFSLKDKKVIITGAAGAIGAQLAMDMADMGAAGDAASNAAGCDIIIDGGYTLV